MAREDLTPEKVRSAYDWCLEQVNELLENGCCVPPEYHNMDAYDALMTASICLIKQMPVRTVARMHNDKYIRYYCPVCHKQQPQTIVGKDINCERCGQRLTVKESNNVTKN